MHARESLFVLLRYVIVLALALGNIYIIYAIFTPLTVMPVYWVLHLAYNAQYLVGDVIHFKGYYANIISACVAGAAYYFLILLNMSTPMPLKKRIYSLIFLLGSFLVLNITRILIFARLLFVGYAYFDLVHMLTWYVGSTVLVVAVWFINVGLFKIHAIPVYTDFHAFIHEIRSGR
jgi:exosortase/archaeosortase